MQVYIRIFLAFIHICQNICIMSVINQLCLAGPADTRMHDRPTRPTAFRWNQKYPRVCGEKSRSWRTRRSVRGSPPHMRGKVHIDFFGLLCRRITPAYAGKRYHQTGWLHPEGDHPRVCGEKRFKNPCRLAQTGSPPRMRGKVYLFCDVSCYVGITPAYAGKRG